MANITDPSHIQFLAERVRPAAERLKLLKLLIDDTVSQWFGGQNAVGSAPTDIYEDDHLGSAENEASAQDVTNTITQLITLQTQLNGGGVMDIINQISVRNITLDV